MASFDSDRFEIGKQLGAGSFGLVYEAFDRQRHRVVALKVLEGLVPDSLARFKREFRSLAEMRHPNLVSLYELLVIGEKWILSMERIVGKDLLEHLALSELQHSFLDRPAREGDTRPGRTPSPQVSAVYRSLVRDCFRQLAVGIAELHAHGIVHRDIKPSNIMITTDGRVVLLDFGLAVKIAVDDSLDRLNIVGTPGYMSPEQVRGEPPSTASDWYSFGVLLFQALTGSLPFFGQNPLEILESQIRLPPPLASTLVPGVDPVLDELSRDLLSFDPGRRPDDTVVLRRLGGPRFEPARIRRRTERATRLIGRREEMRILMEEFSLLQPGQPRIVLLHGAPGCGKSAIADALLDRLRRTSQVMILGGRCGPWESVPLNAIDALVDSLARVLRHQRSPAVDDALGRTVAATRLFPSLAPRSVLPFGDQTVQLPQNGTMLLARAASELSEIVGAAAAERAVVMLLDDAQWASLDSAALLAKIIRGVNEQRLMVVVCERADEYGGGVFLTALGESGATVRQIALHDLPEGNPALMEMMAEEGEPSLAGAIRSRLARLSNAARVLFEGLVESDVPLQEAEASKSLHLFDLDEPLRSLTRERLARVRRSGEREEIDVYHPSIRAAARRPASRRSRLRENRVAGS